MRPAFMTPSLTFFPSARRCILHGFPSYQLTPSIPQENKTYTLKSASSMTLEVPRYSNLSLRHILLSQSSRIHYPVNTIDLQKRIHIACEAPWDFGCVIFLLYLLIPALVVAIPLLIALNPVNSPFRHKGTYILPAASPERSNCRQFIRNKAISL
jgi:hypothetical protein